ncbi:MAG: hypothetical protein WAV20_21795 [Blastocatellia bacterium]
MRRINATIMLLLALTLSNPIAIGAQQQPIPIVGTWDAVKALPSRDELTVILKDGSSKKGRLTDVTDIALILSQGKKLAEIDRDTILQIYRSVPKSRRRAMGTGAAVGAGLGVVTGLFGDGSSGHGVGAGAAIAGVFVMAGVGALIGRGIANGHERVLIYEVRR